MWFGDLVTMRWWDDLWLKESFATYMAVRAWPRRPASRTRGPTFANAGKAWGLRQDELPSTHPIVADIRDLEDVAVNFDGITYAKGAAVLKQLVAWVGDGGVLRRRTALLRRARLGQHDAGRPARALEKTVRAGPVRVVARVAADRRPEHAATGVHTRRRRPVHLVRGAADGPGDHPTLRVAPDRDRPLRAAWTAPWCAPRRHELDVVGAAHRVPDLVGAQRPDLVLLNDDDLTYAKTPARRRVAGDRARAHRRVHRPAPPRAVLGRGLGHDPRRGTGRRATTSRWCSRGIGARDRHRRGRDAARPGRAVPRPVRRPAHLAAVATRVGARGPGGPGRGRARQRPAAGLGPVARHGVRRRRPTPS